MRSSRITRCRACRDSGLQLLVDLGELASCGTFPKSGEPDAESAPLALVKCRSCHLVQLAHDYDGEDLYRGSYGYRSGINESMVKHLTGITRSIASRFPLEANDIVLDIGSNDATLLRSYQAGGLRRIGIDPTIARFIGYYDASMTAVPDFFTAETFSAVFPGEKARVITSISMFYDLPDPNNFVSDIAESLREDGIWVLEQSYLPAMIERNSFDTICHEHLEYYCLHQIMQLCEANGLRVLDVELNDVNGGSFQLTVGHANGPHASNAVAIEVLLSKERDEGYLTERPFVAFMERVDEVGRKALQFLREQKSAGKVVHGYGASTKGNTLLQYFGISADLLPLIADRNEDKDGSRTPGTNIPIVSEAKSRALQPDYYFVLPWHFRDGFVVREQDFLCHGGRLVFPLPEFEIYPHG